MSPKQGIKKKPRMKQQAAHFSNLAVIKLDRELSIWASRGWSIWADHGRSHSGLTMLPEHVLTEDKVGQVERQSCGIPDPHLQQRRQDED